MDSFEFLKLFGSIRNEYILSAQAAPKKSHLPAKRVLLIAAVISLLLILVGCAVIALMGLKDARLGSYEYDMGFGVTQSGDAISLQGFAGSPEYQAAQEWRDFLHSYNPDRSNLPSAGHALTELDGKYRFYAVYTREMAEELDKICGKYGLTLHTQMDLLESQEDLFRRVGGNFLKEGFCDLADYIYDDGTFAFDGEAIVDEELIGFQFRRSVKGSFDDAYLNVWDIAQYQESHITAPTGEDLLLAVNPEKGLIMADLGDCFVSVNVLCGEGQTITEELLQKIATGFDYSILKNVVKPEMDEVLPSEPPETLPTLEGSDAQRKVYRDALHFLYTNYALPGGYEVGYDGISDRADNKFAIYDVDGDGSQELLISYSTTSVAGNTFAIYDYDEATDSVKEELLEYISVSVKESGYLIADASHAHGLGSGGILWPYTLYRYEPATDTYGQVVRVDTWEKQYYPQDFDGNPFPDAIDQDGDGVVHLLYFPDTEDPEVLDEAAFREWESAYPTENVSLPWMHLTLLNIEALVEEQNERYIAEGTLCFGKSTIDDVANYYQAAYPGEEIKSVFLDFDGNGSGDLAVWYGGAFWSIYVTDEAGRVKAEYPIDNGFELYETYTQVDQQVSYVGNLIGIIEKKGNATYQKFCRLGETLSLRECFKFDPTGTGSSYFVSVLDSWDTPYDADIAQWEPLTETEYMERLGAYTIQAYHLKDIAEYSLR